MFQLAITNAQGQTRTVLSTLDHLQYPGYHGRGPGETISIQSTWMCRRRSDWFQAFCPNPKPAPPKSISAPTVAPSK